MQQEISLAICGLGTVGNGLLKILRDRQSFEGQKYSVDYIFDRSFAKKQDITPKGTKATNDITEFFSWFAKKKPDVVIELVGGIETALVLVREAIEHHIPVITANKALMAEHGYSLLSLASQRKTQVYFEAAIAGALPIVRNLDSLLGYQKIEKLEGILNGTTNYILTRMRKEKLDYADVLTDAQAKGLAEADPTLDVSGEDAVHKLALLATMVSGKWVDYHKIYFRGITEINGADVEWANSMNYRIRLIGKCFQENNEDKLFLSLEPTLIDQNHLLYDVEFENNAVSLQAQFSKDHLFVGKGAGSFPTAYSVYSDLQALAANEPLRLQAKTQNHWHYANLASLENLVQQFYIRLRVKDQTGVLANISEIFQKNDISLAKVHQDSLNNNSFNKEIDVVLVTHDAKRGLLLKTLALLQIQNYIVTTPVLLPIDS